MPRPRVRKQIVCPECGRVLKTIPIPVAVAEQELAPDEDGTNGNSLGENGGEARVEVIIEEGPVCPRCAGT